MYSHYCNYYILNYHFKETKDVTLHIDKVYGQISSKKIAVDLNYEDWHDLIENMYEFLCSFLTGYHFPVTVFHSHTVHPPNRNTRKLHYIEQSCLSIV